MKIKTFLVLPLFLAACGGGISGTYEGSGTGAQAMLGHAKLEIKGNGDYYATMMDQTVKGTYEQDGDKVLFDHGNGRTSVGTWAGDTLVLDGIHFVKTK